MVIEHAGRLAANREGLLGGADVDDTCFQNSGTWDSTRLADILNPLETCWVAAKEKTLWPNDQPKQNTSRFRLSKMFILHPNIAYNPLWLWLPAPSWDDSGSAPWCCPGETKAQPVPSNQQLPAYPTRTAPRGKVPLLEIRSPLHSGKPTGPGDIMCAEQITRKTEPEARVGQGKEKEMKMESGKEMVRKSN